MALRAQELLAKEGIPARVVSFPCREAFEEQPEEYRASVLPPPVRVRVAVEAASPFGWERYTGDGGAVVGIERFGASAPGDRLFREFGITPDAVAAKVKELLGRKAGEAREDHGK